MHAVYNLAPVIGDIIAAHCPGTSAREIFMRACFRGEWMEVHSMVEGMLAEPWLLRGYQEARLRDFMDLLPNVAPTRDISQAACAGLMAHYSG
jgi:hypothetical protein